MQTREPRRLFGRRFICASQTLWNSEQWNLSQASDQGLEHHNTGQNHLLARVTTCILTFEEAVFFETVKNAGRRWA
jgi:hypothetical protein